MSDVTWINSSPESMFDTQIELNKINDEVLMTELRRDMIDYCRKYCHKCNEKYHHNKYMIHYCKK